MSCLVEPLSPPTLHPFKKKGKCAYFSFIYLIHAVFLFLLTGLMINGSQAKGKTCSFELGQATVCLSQMTNKFAWHHMIDSFELGFGWEMAVEPRISTVRSVSKQLTQDIHRMRIVCSHPFIRTLYRGITRDFLGLPLHSPVEGGTCPVIWAMSVKVCLEWLEINLAARSAWGNSCLLVQSNLGKGASLSSTRPEPSYNV